jgi:aryl-phospho-beta-D-glucosidase BglC (GH1 family)
VGETDRPRAVAKEVENMVARQLMVAASIAVLVLAGCATPSPHAITSPAVSLGLRIVGNHLVDGAEKPIQLIGAARSSLDYSCKGDGHYTQADYQAMRAWGMNAVRIPLAAPFWLNERDSCPTYQQTVIDAVAQAEAVGMYVILVQAYTSPFGQGHNPAGAGYPMANAAEAPPFWQSLAGHFAHDSHVLFELFSEPHDIDWPTWRDGGMVTVQGDTQRVAGVYTAVGMQQLVAIVNAVAPERIVLVSGNSWGGDLTNVTQGYQLTGRNIIYDVHLYPGPGSSDPRNWPSRFGDLAATAPVIASEFGQLDCGADFITPAMRYLKDHTNGMIAWTWNIGDCGRPALITDWTGTPTSYGQTIHDFYLGAG